MPPRLCIAAIALVSTVCSVAAAEDVAAPFQNASWQITPSLIAGVEHFHYAEGDQQPAVVLDQHTAVLPTAQLAVELTSPFSRFYVRGSFGLKGGSMTYDGATQTGTPVTGPTTGDMTDVEVIVGGRGRIGRRLWLGGYIGVGHHTWERDLRPIGAAGYLEQYAWSYVPAGVVLDVEINRRLTIAIDASIEGAIQTGTSLQISDLQLAPGMTADPATLGLAADAGERLRIATTYAITRELKILGVAGLESFQIDDGPQTPITSNGQPVTTPGGQPLGLSEPFSKTTRYTLSVGASYTF